MKKIIYALLLGSLLWTYQFQAQVTLQALEAGEDTKANINDVVLEIFSFDTTQGILGSQDINIYYTNGEGDFDGTSLKIHLKDGEYSDANDATLNINSGNFNGSGSITAKLIISGDGNFWVKKKDNGEVIDFGEFNVNLNGVTFKVILRSRGGWRATASYSDSRWFERDNCGYNYTPGSSYYTGTAYGEGVSTTSYADAYSKAQDDAYNKYLEQGQRYANNNADCTYNGGGNNGGGNDGGGNIPPTSIRKCHRIDYIAMCLSAENCSPVGSVDFFPSHIRNAYAWSDASQDVLDNKISHYFFSETPVSRYDSYTGVLGEIVDDSFCKRFP